MNRLAVCALALMFGAFIPALAQGPARPILSGDARAEVAARALCSIGDTSLSGKTGRPDQLQRLCYDTAGSANLCAFQPLLRLVTSKQILLGTDFSFASSQAFTAGVVDLNSFGLTMNSVVTSRRGMRSGSFRRWPPGSC